MAKKKGGSGSNKPSRQGSGGSGGNTAPKPAAATPAPAAPKPPAPAADAAAIPFADARVSTTDPGGGKTVPASPVQQQPPTSASQQAADEPGGQHIPTPSPGTPSPLPPHAAATTPAAAAEEPSPVKTPSDGDAATTAPPAPVPEAATPQPAAEATAAADEPTQHPAAKEEPAAKQDAPAPPAAPGAAPKSPAKPQEPEPKPTPAAEPQPAAPAGPPANSAAAAAAPAPPKPTPAAAAAPAAPAAAPAAAAKFVELRGPPPRRADPINASLLPPGVAGTLSDAALRALGAYRSLYVSDGGADEAGREAVLRGNYAPRATFDDNIFGVCGQRDISVQFYALSRLCKKSTLKIISVETAPARDVGSGLAATAEAYLAGFWGLGEKLAAVIGGVGAGVKGRELLGLRVVALQRYWLPSLVRNIFTAAVLPDAIDLYVTSTLVVVGDGDDAGTILEHRDAWHNIIALPWALRRVVGTGTSWAMRALLGW